MALTPGTKLGPYEIVSSLGAGGMGAVYRARDARLDREVAVKVLADAFASDESAMARFEREAMSVAKLSHPNILSIFEFGRDAASGATFVAMELVDGETLRARIEHAPVPVRKAVAYALQIARGLGAAHARGIVHRDLKPENVMITRDDHVKILDFGLAKAAATPGSAEPAATQMADTTPGTVLGTFGYMAPEQVRGLPVDHRADMFAFGAVLHEMLSGARAFRGETAADTMTAILTREPADLDLAHLGVSPGLERIIRRCLEKTPELRFQSANDLAFALETLSSGSGVSASVSASHATAAAVPPAVTPSTRGSRVSWLVAGLSTLAAIAGWLPRGTVADQDLRFDSFTRITELAGEETTPSLSPDGTTVLYSMRVGDSWDVYSQRVGGRNATPVLNDPQRDEKHPVFSPDGATVAFHESDSDGGVFVAGATGESVRRVTEIGFHPAWSPDGRQIAMTTEEIDDPASRLGEANLFVVDASGGTPRKLVDGDAAQPSWSPSGARLVYWANTGGQRDIFTVSVSGGDRVPVTNDPALDWSPVWSPDGRYVYFSSDRGGAMNLWRVQVDASTGHPSGAPEPVTLGVQGAASLASFSRDGTRLAFRSRTTSVNPVHIPFDPVTLRAGEPRLMDARATIRVPSAVSPDGRQIAYFNIGDRQEDLFVGAPDGPMRRVIDDVGRDRAPTFTPDGKSLAFYSNRSGSWQIWMVGLDGSGLRQLTNAPGGAVYCVMSPRGDRIFFAGDDGRSVYETSISGTPDIRKLDGIIVNGLFLNATSISTDGSRLAGQLASGSGRTKGVGVFDLTAKTTVQVSDDETYAVLWLPDNRRVLYFGSSGTSLVVVDTVTRTRTVVDVRLPAPALDEMFALSPDGRSIYYGARRGEADIWIVEKHSPQLTTNK